MNRQVRAHFTCLNSCGENSLAFGETFCPWSEPEPQHLLRHWLSELGQRQTQEEGGASARFTFQPLGKGTGQGLALAHTIIVKKHKGKIWFDTKLGKGTSFYLLLPLEADAQPEPSAQPCVTATMKPL